MMLNGLAGLAMLALGTLAGRRESGPRLKTIRTPSGGRVSVKKVDGEYEVTAYNAAGKQVSKYFTDDYDDAKGSQILEAKALG
jgi:hypothetical protein